MPHDPALVEAVARAIMCARPGLGCKVRGWEVERRDNPHVSTAWDQATAALDAIEAAGCVVVKRPDYNPNNPPPGPFVAARPGAQP